MTRATFAPGESDSAPERSTTEPSHSASPPARSRYNQTGWSSPPRQMTSAQARRAPRSPCNTHRAEGDGSRAGAQVDKPPAPLGPGRPHMSEDVPQAMGLVVIGASAGGVSALSTVVAGLPADLRAGVLVVLHVPSSATSALPTILGRHGPLPARHARDGDEMRPGGDPRGPTRPPPRGAGGPGVADPRAAGERSPARGRRAVPLRRALVGPTGGGRGPVRLPRRRRGRHGGGQREGGAQRRPVRCGLRRHAARRARRRQTRTSGCRPGRSPPC